ncbi:MAG: hypothetical protein ACREFZ_11010, partial [Acetobacteraceae bacterium]
VVKGAVLDRYPHAARELFDAFGAAKRRYLDRLRAGLITAPSAADQMYARVLEITGGGDPLPYGIEPNRAMLETLIGYAREQRILPRSYAMEEVFAPETMHLIA